MATQEQINQFFATKQNKPKIMKVGGKFSFKELPKEMQDEIKKRLAEKDDIINSGLKGELPGIKIDGKTVTKDNIHEFEVKPKKAKEVK